jgi:hypothetical protein
MPEPPLLSVIQMQAIADDDGCLQVESFNASNRKVGQLDFLLPMHLAKERNLLLEA